MQGGERPQRNGSGEKRRGGGGGPSEAAEVKSFTVDSSRIFMSSHIQLQNLLFLQTLIIVPHILFKFLIKLFILR